ncbi:hypothetical protein LINPERPRIM_LOCUS22437, partial [Linum perenne]
MTSRTKNTGDVDKGQCDRLSDEAIMDMEFASWEAAEVFYNAYAKQVGFSIRRRDVRKSRGGELRMVKWMIVIPVACFLPRWTKQAKANESSGTTPTLDNNLVETMRYGALICQCYKLCELAKKNGECYENTMANIARAMNEVANYDFITRLVKRKYEDVKDPDVVRTKGNATVTPKSKGKGRKCGVCHVSGHTRVTCPSNK